MKCVTSGLFAIVLASLAAPAGAFAQRRDPPAGETAKGEGTEHGSSGAQEGAGGRRRTPPKDVPRAEELEALIVVGRIQKPEVFYVLGRTDFSYKGLMLKQSFVDRIGRSVRNNPF